MVKVTYKEGRQRKFRFAFVVGADSPIEVALTNPMFDDAELFHDTDYVLAKMQNITYKLEEV